MMQAQLFSRTLDELEVWMDEVELQLQSEDHGKDLASVIHLLKRHSLLEGDVSGHSEAVEQVKDTAAVFQSSNHFMGDEIQERAVAVIRRSVSPSAACTSIIRNGPTTRSLLLFLFGYQRAPV
jgi:spectrin beta